MFKKYHIAAAMAAIALLSAGAASAEGLTRAQVQAQVLAARANGTLDAFDGEDSGSDYLSAHFHSTETRAQVRAETAKAAADGTLDLLDRQDSGSEYLTENFHSTEPRSEVKAGVAAAEKNGTLNAFTGDDSGSFYLSHTEQTHPRVAAAK